jgi:hypothetical protein
MHRLRVSRPTRQHQRRLVLLVQAYPIALMVRSQQDLDYWHQTQRGGEMERGVGEASGLCKRWGCVFRMRWTRRGSEAWIARRRRREGSILISLLALSRCRAGMGRMVHRDSISLSVLVLCSAQQAHRNNVRGLGVSMVLLIGGRVWLDQRLDWNSALAYFCRVLSSEPLQTPTVKPHTSHHRTRTSQRLNAMSMKNGI